MFHFNSILNSFGISAGRVDVTRITSGLINDTYRVTVPGAEDDNTADFLVQRINQNVFKRPDRVMDNIVSVSEFMRSKLSAEGKDSERSVLSFFKSSEGSYLYRNSGGACWRICRFIDGASTYDVVENPQHFNSAGRAYGRFLKTLCGYPAETLHVTIPGFHNTPSRLEDFKKAVRSDPAGRREGVREDIDFLLERADMAGRVADMLESGVIPERVTHNDTKINNVLIDDVTGEGVCVIDLDTVMPGSCLYDFGDAVRSGANPGGEETRDLSSVFLDTDLFKRFTAGYLKEASDALTAPEKENLAFSAKLMAFELALRFLGDYLSGDTYFKTTSEHHNFHRARTQIKLLADMEEKYEEMKSIVSHTTNS